MAAVAEMGEVDEIVHSNEESIKGGNSINSDACDFKDGPLSDSNEAETIPDTIEINDDPVASPTHEISSSTSSSESEDDDDSVLDGTNEATSLVDDEDNDPILITSNEEMLLGDDDDNDPAVVTTNEEILLEEDDDNDQNEITSMDDGDNETVNKLSSPECLDKQDSAFGETDLNEKLKTDIKKTREDLNITAIEEDSDLSTDNELEQIEPNNDEGCLPNGVLNEEDPTGANNTEDVTSIVIHDSVDNEDVLVIDDKDPTENGSIGSNTDSTSNRSTPSVDSQLGVTRKKCKKRYIKDGPPRRSSRQTSKETRSNDGKSVSKKSQDESESDIEEILPEDPLADTPMPVQVKKITRASPTIIIKDTKSLVDIASISSASTNKSEPTLVIIDTNSILSGRGPVPVVHKQTASISNTFSSLPAALPAQGLYPANMRATITPIPLASSLSKMASSPQSMKQASPQASLPPVLPTLTDDMYVVEAPSFIVPYVYEKPPVNDLKELVKNLEVDIKKEKNNEENEGDCVKKEKVKSEDVKDDDEMDIKDKPIDVDKLPSMDVPSSATLAAELKKPATYFDSPLGKFFIGIGSSLVQEVVQNDLLKQQKRKRDREASTNAETIKTISSLLKNLEFTKENNEPFFMETKKCEFCSFRTESALAMSFHLETPHMKNYIYRCNFCTYEVRSPHDILYHMEVHHGVRGRLERAPAFHQCPNCPFEDNQKGKLSRHLVTCARKFKPERNLEPPIDYEPPAKIPRAPRMKQQNLGTAAVYQAMARIPQFQTLTKVPTQVANIAALNRNRGRPTLGNVPSPIKPANIRSSPSMIFKPTTMSGGSVLLPSNYQIGNQVYQTQQQQSSQQPNILSKIKTSSQPSISITALPRGAPPPASANSKPGDSNSKASFVICEICDGYIKDLEQLRNHMQWIHKVKIHPKMIYNRPPLNCQKCQFRFFTDQGLERHLLGSHGLVTSSMQEAANKSKDSGRCPVCGRVYQWKLLNHVARDHNMTLKPAHLSYKCTVCTATFGMYKQFESHVYSAHSVVAKRAMDKKNTNTSVTTIKNDSVLKPLKINDEITIIPQPTKLNNEESAPSTSGTSVTIRNSIRQSNGSSEIHEVDDDSSSGSSLLREKRRKILSDN